MLRALLRDSEAAKEIFEKVGLFKSPELLEKYVIASEVTVEVLGLLFSRIFGTAPAPSEAVSDAVKELGELVCGFPLGDRKGDAGEDLSGRAEEPSKEVEGLRAKVQDMERRLGAMQRQLHMQGEVSELAVSLDRRLDEVALECERRVASVSERLARAEREVRERAGVREVELVSEEVSRLKEGERKLKKCISGVLKKAEESERVLRDEVQGEIRRLDGVVTLLADPWNGIIARLAHECGGNVHEKGVVEVTASGCCDGFFEAKYAVELGTDSFFYSNSDPNSWICYDFKGRRVAPASYSIRTGHSAFPRSWVLEVSNSGSDGSWEVVDGHKNNEDLNDKRVTRNFVISAPPRGSFRFVRLRQTGKNHGGDDCLCLTSLELFGTLSPQ